MGGCCSSGQGSGDGAENPKARAAQRATAKAHTSKASQNDKIERAAKTGMLGLADGKLKVVPPAVFTLPKVG